MHRKPRPSGSHGTLANRLLSVRPAPFRTQVASEDHNGPLSPGRCLPGPYRFRSISRRWSEAVDGTLIGQGGEHLGRDLVGNLEMQVMTPVQDDLSRPRRER